MAKGMETQEERKRRLDLKEVKENVTKDKTTIRKSKKRERRVIQEIEGKKKFTVEKRIKQQTKNNTKKPRKQ